MYPIELSKPRCPSILPEGVTDLRGVYVVLLPGPVFVEAFLNEGVYLRCDRESAEAVDIPDISADREIGVALMRLRRFTVSLA